MMKAEEKRNMRKYGKDGRLESVICNRCGRKLAGMGSCGKACFRRIMRGISFRRRMGRFTILICVRSAMMR